MELNQLVKRAQAGDSQAFQEVAARFTGLVKKYAGKNHLRPIAEEAKAQGWLAVAQAVKSYDEHCGVHFAGYVDSKIKFAVWNLFKKERRRWQEEELSEGSLVGEGPDVFAQLVDKADVAQEVETKCLSEELMKAVRMLPAKQQQVVLETIVGHKRLKDVAGELGITVQAIYNLRQRGLARLKTLCNGMYSSERG